ncbi:hypothetical protein, partial [Chlorobaculum thiosulfatiphilum]|uniref:hypothetical protein n=1 Tax=Chlorobaculum thiosulfatiphilum TaxID=115852 RepID=UPI001B881FC7
AANSTWLSNHDGTAEALTHDILRRTNFLKKTQLLGLRVMTPSSPCSTNCFFDPVDGFYVHIQHTPAESGNTGRFRPSACLFY